MLKLYGFAVSNYQSKVKLVMLEKGIPFEEVLTYPAYGKAYEGSRWAKSRIWKPNTARCANRKCCSNIWKRPIQNITAAERPICGRQSA